MFDWKWYLKDIKQDKDVKVFSTFSCGGGSTMGYKRAGFKVLGNVEIDKKINEMYVKNFNPKYNFNMDLREFNLLENLPQELYQLDILDGSPPCSTFSMAGVREKAWGKEKKFREGQKLQTLDDLFFVFLDTVKKLNPKIFIAENVVGILQGNAKGYVSEIIKKTKEIGYDVQIFQLNSATMEVPQSRERVFFIANRINANPLKLNFNYPPIYFKEVRSEISEKPQENSIAFHTLSKARPTDRAFSDVYKRIGEKERAFGSQILQDNKVAQTITSGGMFYRFYDKGKCTDEDFRNIQSFPQDYDFNGNSAHYVCGMSVPPNMMAHIATEVYNQWIK